MSLLGKLTGEKPKRKPRGKARSSVEKLAAEDAAYLRQLKRTNPAKWEAIMDKRMNMTPQDPMSTFFDTWERLAKGGMLPPPREEGIKEYLKDGVVGLLQFFGQWQQMSQQANQDGSEQPTYQMQPQYQPPSLPQAQIEPVPQIQQIQQEVQVSIISRIIISQLDGKTPEEAAKWISSRSEAKDLMVVLQDTPDDKVFLLLGQYATAAPDLAGLIAWLQTRQQWTLDTIRQLKALSGNSSPSGL